MTTPSFSPEYRFWLRTSTILATATLGALWLSCSSDHSAGPDAGTTSYACTVPACNPPTCCGSACSSTTKCCDGTTCSSGGQCIPEECSLCGSGTCNVDFTTCTGTCAAPSTCLNACTSASDCSTGTVCMNSTGGSKACYPSECQYCGGLTPVCSTTSACAASCIAPASCGKVCTATSDCDSFSVCQTFTDGTKYCVPSGFQASCTDCGSLGCSFLPSTCGLTCKTPTTPPTADAGPPTHVDAGTGPIQGGDAGGYDASEQTTTAPVCLACCADCVMNPGPNDGVCCGDSVCMTNTTGGHNCFPSICQDCSYGCTFKCPTN